MKKILSPALALVIALSMLLVCLSLSGCAGTGGDENGNENGNKGDGAPLSVIANGETNYVLVRSASAGSEEKSIVSDLRTDIRMNTAVMLDVVDDNGEIEEGKGKLIVGSTGLPETADAASALGENQFRFLAVGDSVVIAASNSSCLDLAVDTFVTEYVKSDGITVPSNLDRTWQCEMQVNTRTVANPINDEGDDPDVVEHNGTYYYCWSGGNGVYVSKADSLDKISKSGGVKVYTAPSGTMYSSEYWAPELHYLDGNWYIYVAADDGNDINHRMYVLKGTSQDPTRPFKMVGKISDPSDKWAIDGTVVFIKNEMYFVWSGWSGDNDFGNQKIYIAHMSDPTAIDGKRVQLSAHENSWEGGVNEGPYALYANDTVYIVYSANGSWSDDYCLAYLKFTGTTPLRASSWEKSGSPILSKSTTAYGPGHASIVQLADGSYWLVYHANLESGTGWSGRSVWIQPMTFKSNGDPKSLYPKKSVEFPIVKWVVSGEI